MSKLKSIIPIILVIFVVYAIVISPQQAADVVSSTWNILVDGVTSIFAFFRAIIT